MKKTRKKHFKYNLILLNESTLEEVFRIRTSRLSVTLILGLFTLISFGIIMAVIFFTPIKHMLPGYNDVAARNEVLKEAQRLDSLESIASLNDKQLLIIKNIIADEIKLDTMLNVDSIDINRWNQLPLLSGEKEKEFVAKYEEENAYNINAYMENASGSQAMVFAAPSYGTITEHFSKEKGIKGISIITPSNRPVLATHTGNIILEDYSPSEGYTIIIQHENGYISIYKNIIQILHPLGTHVKSGEAIGFANTLKFELWYDGIAINPEDNIVF